MLSFVIQGYDLRFDIDLFFCDISGTPIQISQLLRSEIKNCSICRIF